MNIPSELQYSEQHEWIRVEGEQAVIGITEFAQNELGDIVFVELPKVGDTVTMGEPFGSMESVKTVSELYSPVSGKVIKINESLEATPGKVNTSPYDEGWMIVVALSDASEISKLWSAEQYADVYGE